MGRKSKLTSNQIEKICKEYLAGKTMKDLSEKYPLSSAGICLLLHKEGISGRQSSNRKYSVDETFFDVIDTEAKAYWLGFITTDGHIRHKGVEIEISIEDKDHLEKFRQDIKAEHPITIRDRKLKGHTVRIYISSRKLSIALNKLGLESNKTFNVRVNKNLPNDLLRHFWRGAIDGDGFLSKRKGVESRIITLSSASKKFLSDFKAFVISHIPRFKGNILQLKNRNCYSLTCSGIAGPRQLAHILYYRSSVYLDRKMKLAKEIMNIKENYIDLSSLDRETLEYLYRECDDNWTSVGKVLGISRDSLFALRQKLKTDVERIDSPLNHLSIQEKVEAIEKAQQESKNNHEAAKKLGLSYNTFYYLRKKLGIRVHSLPEWMSYSDDRKIKIISEAVDNNSSKRKAALKLKISVDLLLKERKRLNLL